MPDTVAAVYQLAADFWAESGALKLEVRAERVATSLIEIDRERAELYRNDLFAGDPLRLIGGQFAIPNSTALGALTQFRAELTSTNLLARQLHSIQVSALAGGAMAQAAADSVWCAPDQATRSATMSKTAIEALKSS